MENQDLRYIHTETSDNPKRLPELYDKKEHCCGCSACYSICPTKAIAMQLDTDGFFYPVVDAEKCIRCYRCEKVCVFKADQKKRNYF